MLNISLTFDYELFFGQNFGTADEILFNPTKKLLEILDKHNIKATFFIDVLSAYMHKKYGLIEYCEKFEEQIKDMVSHGHDVQLHIHSNWLKSKYQNGMWVFDVDSYRIHTFGFSLDDKLSAYNIIKWGKNYLESIARDVNKNYRCIAYRAGGYSIQPHEKLFKALIDNDIFIDSSVAMMQEAHAVNEYDYKNVPDINGWWIGLDSSINESVSKTNAAVYEVPVAYYKQSIVRRLLTPSQEQYIPHNLRGTYIKLPSSENKTQPYAKQSILKRAIDYNKTTRILSLDSINYKSIIKTLVRREKKNKSPYQTVAVIGHPKIIDDLWLSNINNFLTAAKKHKKLRLIPISDIASFLKI